LFGHRCPDDGGRNTGIPKFRIASEEKTRWRRRKQKRQEAQAECRVHEADEPERTLGAVIGSGAMPRTEVTKKIWAYIKRNGLQDKKNRRNINADDKLKPVFGGKSQVSMFEMTKLVNKHLK
jgi:chromatin remodeling complex protein RSC6